MISDGKHFVLAKPCPRCGNREPDLVHDNAESIYSGLYAFQCQADRGDGKPCAATWDPETGKRLFLPSDADASWCSLYENRGGTKAERDRAHAKEISASLKRLVADGSLRKQLVPGRGWVYDTTAQGRAKYGCPRDN